MEKESHQDPYEIIRQLSGIKGSFKWNDKFIY